MSDLLRWLGPEDFCPRKDCGAWESWVLEVSRWSDWGLVLWYLLIGAAIGTWVRNRHARDFRWMFNAVGFGVFPLCAGTHFWSALAFDAAFYRSEALWKLLTLIVSGVAAALVWRSLPKSAKYRPRSELVEEMETLALEVRQFRKAMHERHDIRAAREATRAAVAALRRERGDPWSKRKT